MRNNYKIDWLSRFFLVLTLVAVAAPVGAQLPDPVSWWPLDEGTGTVVTDAVDSNDGTVVGPTWAPGVLGNSLHFAGTSDHVAIPNSASLDITGTEITLVAWIKPDVIGHSDGSRIISKPSTGGGDEVYSMSAVQDRLAFRIDGQTMESTGQFIPGEWIHVTMVYNGVDKRIYLNGILDPATPQLKSDNIDASFRQLYLGRKLSSNRYFVGQIDEVRVYNVALSAPQVALLASPAGVNAPPQVDAGADDTTRLPAATVSLDGTVTDDGLPLPTPMTTWSMVSGPAVMSFADAAAIDTTATFTVPGTYVLRLLADDSVFQGSDTVTITVEAVSVLTSIVVSPPGYSLAPAQTQQFTATGLDQYGEPIAASPVWTASGGSISVGGLYTAGVTPGFYDATATDGAIFDSVQVTISATPPVADANGPYVVNEGASATVDGSGSTDPGSDIVAWDWDFNNDGIFGDETGVTAQFVAGLSGVHTIALKVTDLDGAMSVDTTTVTVNNLPPTANAGGPYMVDQGGTVGLDAAASSDPGDDIVSYEWELNDDGLYDDAIGPTPIFDVPLPGTFPVSVRVTDDDAATGFNTVSVIVADTAPTAPATLSAASGDNRVTLSWPANAEADIAGYRVNRATVSGGPYTDVSGLVAGLSYDDTTVTNDVPYYYVLVAEDAAGNPSVNSDETMATPELFPAGHAGPYYAANESSWIGFADDWLPNKATPTKITFQFVEETGGIGNTMISADGDRWYFSYPNPDSGDPATEQVLRVRLFSDVDYELAEPAVTTEPGDMLTPTALNWNQVTIEWPTLDADTATVTINGVAENVPMGTRSIPAPTKTYLIARYLGKGEFGDGYLRNVRVSENGSLVHHWMLNDNSLTIADSGPGNHVGMLSGTPVGNWVQLAFAPVVEAGEDQTIRLPASVVNLDGTVTDDGQPIPAPITTWSMISGPAGVTFGAAGAVDTTATFTVAGTYVLQLLADDTDFQSTDTVTITVEAAPVLAGLVVAPSSSALVPAQTEQFTATGFDQYGNPIAASPVWTATGGTIGAGGLYTAGVTFGFYDTTATDGAVVGSASVTISATPPVADANGPYVINEGASATVDGSGSTDPGSDIVAWDWDFDNDGDFGDASGETAQFVAGLSGVHTIALKVTDIDGAASVDTTTVTVNNLSPIANAGGPYVVDQGNSIGLDASASSDPGDDIVSYDWELNDNALYDDAADPTATFDALVPGSFPVSVRVTDDDAATGFNTVSVIVGDTIPAAPATLSAVSGDGRVTLSWLANAEADIVGYRVYRAAVPGGPYTDVSGLVAGLSYDDTTVINDVPYFYVLVAEDAAGNPSANSGETTATPELFPAGHPGPFFAANETSWVDFVDNWLPDKATPTKITFEFVEQTGGVGNTMISADGDKWYFSYPNPNSGDPATDKVLRVRLFSDVDYDLAEPAMTTAPGEMLSLTTLNWNQVTIEWPTLDANTATVTINGVAENVPMGDIAIAGGTQAYLIARYSGGGEFGDGYLRNVRVSENGSLVHHWMLNDNGTTIADSGPGNLAGMLNGTPLGSWVQLEAPLADAGTDQAIRLPALVANLDGTVTDDGQPIPAPITTWSQVSGPVGVTFGAANAVDTTATFPGLGTYVLQLLADDTTYQVSDTVTISVEPMPVLTSLVVLPAVASLQAGQTQQYTATGLDQYGEPVAAVPLWSATGGIIDAAGLYTSGAVPGSFVITATDGIASGNATLAVIGSPPIADAGGPYFATEGASITLDGSASGDPNGDIVEWNWDFDNDGQYDDATGETPQYVAGLPGINTVDLQVVDLDGTASTDAATVAVTDSIPMAPADVVATAGDAQVTVTWTANTEPDLAGYRVHRSTTQGGPYSDVSGLITGVTFLDLTVTNGVTYYYVVTAEDTSGFPSMNSTEESATPDATGIPGDVNDDGFVNVMDLLLMERHVTGLTVLDPGAITRGDLYPVGAGDGQITISDLLMLQRLVQP